MKSLAIIFFTFILIGCGGGGGSDESPESTSQPAVIPNSAQTTPLLVIQIEFQDYTFTDSTSNWANKIFGTSLGQLNNYFLEISQNTFTVTAASESYGVNDGFIKVFLNYAHPNPANGTSNFDTTIAIPALTIANTYIDFSTYDTNNNSEIEKSELQIMFLVSGGEQATGLGPDNGDSGIWAHQFFVNGVVFDGVSVMQYPSGSYTAFGERHFHFDNRGNDATIGIIAHELGHGIFALPDLYDVDGSSQGIGAFGLMGSGSWGYVPGGNSGARPSHMSAYSKIESNFVTANVINTDTNNYDLFASNSNTYKPLRVNTNKPNEYFLIENRSSTGYDSGLFMLDNATFSGGLAIWHIDESQKNNTYPNENDARRLVDLEEADAKTLDIAIQANNNSGDRGNLFYGGTNNFTPVTTPSNSNFNDSTATDIEVTNITEAGSTATIDITF